VRRRITASEGAQALGVERDRAARAIAARRGAAVASNLHAEAP
jgi:hypothetical protein